MQVLSLFFFPAGEEIESCLAVPLKMCSKSEDELEPEARLKCAHLCCLVLHLYRTM